MGADRLHPHWWWRDRPTGPGRAVVADVDGVLADAQGRQHLLEGPTRDWRAFFDACGEDPVVSEVRTLLALLDESLHVLVVTARPVRIREATLAWLDAHELRYDLLVMRPHDVHAPAVDVKRAVVDELRDAGFRLELAIEDHPEIRDMYDEVGVPCLYLHSGYYED